jgi:hypothetical protein
MFPGKTMDMDFLNDLHDYARSLKELFYYDICACHHQDVSLAVKFLADERDRRKPSV